jgi:peptidoglycan/xylan/chitin deacetylase (PgdA/CDA1 family)
MTPTARELQLLLVSLTATALLGQGTAAQTDSSSFSWPEGKRAAVSLSFDDARLSQIDAGMALLDRYGVKATFFVGPRAVEQRLDGWKQAVAAGHEIGNHSLNHPCSGNFAWSRDKALEDYSLDQMRSEITEANRQLEGLLGVTPRVFAYPCGQKFVGRGRETRSYVPLVAELFTAGRSWMDESPNDPLYCDVAKLTGMEMDGRDFEDLRPLLEQVKEGGQWLVLGGHEMGPPGIQTTRLTMLEDLIAFAQDSANELWIAPVGTVAEYVVEHGGCGQADLDDGVLRPGDR